MNGEARLAERLHHHLVSEQGQGPEADEAVPRREEGQPLEKKAAEALSLKLVIHREGDLGAGARRARHRSRSR